MDDNHHVKPDAQRDFAGEEDRAELPLEAIPNHSAFKASPGSEPDSRRLGLIGQDPNGKLSALGPSATTVDGPECLGAF